MIKELSLKAKLSKKKICDFKAKIKRDGGNKHIEWALKDKVQIENFRVNYVFGPYLIHYISISSITF